MAFGTPVVNLAHNNSITSPYAATVAAVTAGRIIVVQAYASRATSLTPTDISLTDSSGSPLTWTPVFATQPVSDNGTTRSKHQWWWAVSDGGSKTLSLASASASAVGAEIIDFSIGAGKTPDFTTNQASAEATTGTSTTSDPVCTLPTAPAAADLGLLFMMGQGGGALSAITGWTSLTRTSVNSRSMNSAYDTSSAGQSVTWINNGNPAALITMVAVIEATAGGGTTDGALATTGSSTASFGGASLASGAFSIAGSTTVAFASYPPLSVGVNMSSLEYAWQVSPTTFNWDYVESRNFQTVRIPVAWERLQPTLGGALDATFLAQYTAAVNQALSRGMNVIIDVHNYGTWDPLFDPIIGSPPGTYNHGYPGLSSGAYKLGSANLTQAHFVDLWTRLATAFAGTPGIAYGLMNEPHDLFATNLVASSNHFANTKGSQAWFTGNSAVLTSRQATSLSGFNDAWTLTDGGNFGFVAQAGVVFGSGAHTFSVEVSTASGSVACGIAVDFANALNFTATTTKQRFSKSFTPGAGAHNISIQVNTNSGNVVRIANAQVNAGAGTTYTGDVWPQAAQAAINAIRLVDQFTPIYVAGDSFSRTEDWLITNVNLADITDPSNRLTFEGHTYFDGAGGSYSSSYDTIVAGDAYGSGATRGTNFVQPLVTFGTTYGKRIFVGEVSVPNDDARWGSVMTGFQTTLGTTQVRSCFWEYHTHKPTDPSFVLDTGKLNLGRDNGTDAPQLAFLQPLTSSVSAAFTINGSSAAAFGGNTIKSTAFSTGGTSTASFSSAAVKATTFSTGGLSATAFGGLSSVAANGVLNTSGTSTAAFSSAAAAISQLQTSGTSTADFKGSSAAEGALQSTGSSTAAFTGSSASAPTTAVFSMGGSSSVAFVGPTKPFALASMFMHFADDVYVGATPADVTVVRAQTVTSYARNKAGQLIPFGSNVLRKTDLGVFTEEQRTNSAFWSQKFNSQLLGGVTVNETAIIAPDGTLTGNSLTETLASIPHTVQNGSGNISFAAGTTYAFSVYAKAGTSNFIQLTTSSTSSFSPSPWATFNVLTGVITQTGGSPLTAYMEPWIDGWWRCVMVATATGSAFNSYIVCMSSTGTDARTPSYLGTGLTVYVSDTQCESVPTGSQYYASSYIPTTTVAVQRPRDNLLMTGAAVSNWYTGGTAGSGGTSVGTSYVEFSMPPTNGGNQFVIDFSQGGAGVTEEQGVYVSSNRGGTFLVNQTNTTQAQIFSAGALGTVGSTVKQAFTWAKDDFRYWSNGAQAGTPDTSGNTPSVNQLAIGQRGDTTFYFNGFIRCIAYAPFTSSNFALYSITLLPNVLPGAIFDWGFNSNSYYGLPSTALSFTRATPGWAPDAAGNLIAFPSGAPRITDLGLWVEEARTQSIRNNTMQGGGAGVLPTNWSTFTAQTGITVTPIGKGVESNIEYFDVQFAGTPSGTGFMSLFFEDGATISGLTGQTWVNAAYLRLIGGSGSNVVLWRLGLSELTNAGGFVTNVVSNISVPPSTGALGLNRQSVVLTTAGGGTTGKLQPYFRFEFNSGGTFNFTIRIGLPCFEQGAFAQTANKTYGAAVTRNTDVPNITGTNFTAIFNTAQGGIYVEGTPQFGSAASRRMIDINDGTNANRLLMGQSNVANTARALVTTGGSAVADMFATTLTALANNKLAMAYAVDNYNAVVNNGSSAFDTLGAVPGLGTTGQLSIGIDHAGSTASANGGPIKRIALYAFRPTTPFLGQITTPGSASVFGSSGSSSNSFGSPPPASSGAFAISGSTTISFASAATSASVLSTGGSTAVTFASTSSLQVNGELSTSGSSTASFASAAASASALSTGGSTAVSFASTSSLQLNGALSTGGSSLASFGGASLASGALSTGGSSAANFASSALKASALSTGGLTSIAFGSSFGTGANGVFNPGGVGTASFQSTATAASVVATTGSTIAGFGSTAVARSPFNTGGTSTVSFAGATIRQLAASQSITFGQTATLKVLVGLQSHTSLTFGQTATVHVFNTPTGGPPFYLDGSIDIGTDLEGEMNDLEIAGSLTKLELEGSV